MHRQINLRAAVQKNRQYTWMHKFNQTSITCKTNLSIYSGACNPNLNTDAPIVDRACLARISLSPVPILKRIRETKC